MLWVYGTIHSYCSECCVFMALSIPTVLNVVGVWHYPFLLFECYGRMALCIPTVLNVVGVWHYPFLLFSMLWAYGAIHSYCSECCGRMALTRRTKVSVPEPLTGSPVGAWVTAVLHPPPSTAPRLPSGRSQVPQS